MPLSRAAGPLYTRESQIASGGGQTASSLDIDGLTDIGADIADADLIIIDDGGGGTNRKSAVTRIPTYVFSALGLDEDGFDSDSATKFATQQSIKAYVDAQVTAQDLDATTDSGTIAIDLDSETLTIAGGEGIDTSATGNTITIAGEDATTSNKGVASFSSDNFAVSSGAVTIKDGGVANAELAGSIANAKLANSSITVADGSSSTAVALGGTITFAGTSNEVEVGESSGTVTIGLPDDVTIAGDLTVNGDTVTVNTATLSVEDPLILLGNGNGADSVDLGLYAKYTDSGVKYAGFFRDASDSDKWKLFATTGNSHEAPTTTVNTTSGFTLGTLVVDSLEGTITTAAQTNITSIGTIATGTWEATDIAVAHGGTGASTLTANGVLIGNGTSAITSVDMSTKGHILIGDGSGNPSMLAIGTNNHVLTADSSEATGVKWAAASGGMSAWILEDDDGTEVSISDAEEVKFIGAGITTNWTDTSDGSDGDPFDLTFTVDAAQTGITSIYATDLILGEDAETAIDFGTANEIDFKADNAARLTLSASAFYPVTNNQIDLGTSSLEFKDAFFDGTVTADAFAGPLTGNVTGTADVATVATTVTITDNESTDEDNAIIFTAGGDVDGGNIGLESDGTLTYNPSSGLVTATAFAGALTGNVTGNASGTAATVTGAAQTNITSLGTLTALTVDDVAVDGKVITMTGSSSDTAVFTAGTNGTLSIVTTDAAAAAANIQITADGTVDIDSAGVLTLDSGAAINIEPASGSAILLDGTISIDAGVVTGATSITSTAFVGDITGDVTGTADVATVATTVTITDNESTNENNAVIFTAGGDVDGGNLGLESDGNLTYNPSNGTLTATAFSGALTGNVTGTADVATVATTVTITDNESTDEDNAIIFTAGGDVDGGNIGLESDGTLTYNPSTGLVTATAFAGALTGNVTGNASGTAATVTGAAQTNITSLGTLTALTVDDVAVNGKVITMTGSSSDTAVMTVAANGAFSLVTTDAAAAAANVQITADGTVDIDSAGVLTLDSGAAINIEPASGSAILLDGTISIDAGVVTGATSITSTAFVGDITGDVTGNASGTAATVTGAAQTNITSLGTLTALTVDDVAVNGKVITMTGSTDDTAVMTVATNGALTIETTDTAAAAANIQITADGTAELAGTTVTLDSAGAVVLDSATGIVNIQDGGSTVLSFTEGNSGDVTVKLETNAKDLVFTDNGDATNMKILDAAAGINVPGEVQTTGIGYTDGDNALTIADGGGVTVAQDLTMTADKSLNFPQGANIKFTDAVTNDSIDDHDAQGIIFTFTAGMTVTPFSPVYLHTDNEVHECDADAIATMPCIGVSINTSNVTDGNPIEVMLMGLIRDESFTDFGTDGAPVYVSTSVGEMTNTAPSGTDDVVQVIGHSIGEKLLFVQPCLTTLEHS